MGKGEIAFTSLFDNSQAGEDQLRLHVQYDTGGGHVNLKKGSGR